MGETRVDLLHLLEDLRDAYPASLEETIVTEALANALDAGATRFDVGTDADARTVTFVDDGSGMNRPEVRRYHDLATSSKRRGHGIGFAGVGIKLGLLVSDEVVTESRRGKTHLATSWRLSSRHRAPWKWIDPPGHAGERGTAVRMTLANALSELLDPRFLDQVLRRHFEPLLDPDFDPILTPLYPQGVRLAVNGRPLERGAARSSEAAAQGQTARRASLEIRIGRKRKPAAIGWLELHEHDLPEQDRGIAIATRGKVIKRGWDWLGLTPQQASRIRGLIEAPALAESLTLNKADFLRSGPRGANYLAYRKSIQQTVSEHLALWGGESAAEPRRRPRTRSVERDLRNVLVDLSDDFPMLATLVGRRSGGQRRLALGDAAAGEGWAASEALVAERAPEDSAPQAPAAPPSGSRPPDRRATEPTDGTAPPATAAAASAHLTGRSARKAPAHYALEIRLESRPEVPQIARLIESTVWVNDAHPAFRRALSSRAEGYHLALATALALAPLVVEPQRAHEFITLFLERWGESGENGRG